MYTAELLRGVGLILHGVVMCLSLICRPAQALVHSPDSLLVIIQNCFQNLSSNADWLMMHDEQSSNTHAALVPIDLKNQAAPKTA